MRFVLRGCLAFAVFVCGYLLGSHGLPELRSLQAQNQPTKKQQGPTVQLSEETAEKVRQAHEAIATAMRALKDENRYTAASRGANAFAVLSGGLNAREDLEKGRGVDPETFAALYAGRAVPEVADHISRDPEGRLTYKNELVRMYPISRLKRLFALQDKFSGAQPDEGF